MNLERYAWPLSLSSGILMMLVVSAATIKYEIGPGFLWTADACPGTPGTCGVIPLGAVVASFIGAILTVWIYGMLTSKETMNQNDTHDVRRRHNERLRKFTLKNR